MKKLLFALFLAGLLSLPVAAWAELAYVSGVDEPVAADGDPEDVALFPPAPWDPVAQELTDEGDFRGAGFPLWYQDTAGLRLTLCLDGEEEEFPCAWEGSPVFTSQQGCEEGFDFLYPYQEVVGFGDEAFYFKTQSYPFDIELNNGGFAQLQLLLETTWGEDDRIVDENEELLPLEQILAALDVDDLWIEDEEDGCLQVNAEFLEDEDIDLHRVEPGYEMLFARIRLRLLDNAPAGWYRMVHPYGVKTLFRPVADVGQRTEVRQVVGDLDAGLGPDFLPDYTIPLNDAGTLVADNNFVIPEQYIGLRETGFTNDGNFTDAEEVHQLKSIGPFLVWADYLDIPALRIEEEVENGENGMVVHQYIGVPADEDNPVAAPGAPVLGAPYFDAAGPEHDGQGAYANYFKVLYLNTPEASPPTEADWLSAPVVGFTSDFNVVGKVAANCAEGVNEPPVVAAEEERELIATAVNRPVTFDPFINDQPGDLPIFKLMTLFEEVAEGAEVIFNPDRGTVTYVPVADQAYADEFTYTLRDACGTESAGTAMLTVVVEDLQINRADYRTRTGRWLISGTSSHTIANEIRLYAGQFDPEDEAANRLIGTAPVGDDGAWTFNGKATASPGPGTVTAVSALGVASDAFDLVLR
jgi:hypothetical protein